MTIKLKDLLGEWNDTSFKKLPKRWSKTMDGDTGLTEFETAGGKDIIKEGKSGAIYNMKAQMKDGTFEPDNPEVLIRGWGRLPLKSLENNVRRDLEDLAKRAKQGGESNFKGIVYQLTKNDVVVEKAKAVYDVYQELNSSKVKRAITIYKRRK